MIRGPAYAAIATGILILCIHAAYVETARGISDEQKRISRWIFGCLGSALIAGAVLALLLS